MSLFGVPIESQPSKSIKRREGGLVPALITGEGKMNTNTLHLNLKEKQVTGQLTCVHCGYKGGDVEMIYERITEGVYRREPFCRNSTDCWRRFDAHICHGGE